MTPEWNQTDMRNLLELWDKGRSTAEIGRRVGVTTNAVVGKAQESNCRLAHRLFGRQIRCRLTRTAAEIGRPDPNCHCCLPGAPHNALVPLPVVVAKPEAEPSAPAIEPQK